MSLGKGYFGKWARESVDASFKRAQKRVAGRKKNYTQIALDIWAKQESMTAGRKNARRVLVANVAARTLVDHARRQNKESQESKMSRTPRNAVAPVSTGGVTQQDEESKKSFMTDNPMHSTPQNEDRVQVEIRPDLEETKR